MCQGDTIKLYAISNYADSFAWYTNYNINAAYDHTDSVKVWPAYSTGYGIKIFYPDGCIVDTVIHVHVSEVRADAGPDRTIADGAVTTLGGPGTSLNGSYNYHWTPYQYVNDTTLAFPNVNPPADYTYYLEVTEYNDQYRCQAHDTVVVHVNCGDFYLPNAFAPGTESPGANKFGILNKQISQLNYFRIFDRWGNLVFETSNPADQWDGTYNGSPAPVGVYVWIADGFCNGGKPINKKGNVTLLR